MHDHDVYAGLFGEGLGMDAYRFAGFTLAAGGVIAMAFGLFSDVTVSSPGRYETYLGYIEGSRTVNFHRMFVALTWLVAGGFTFLGGLVLVAASSLLKASNAVAPADAGSAKAEDHDKAPMPLVVGMVALALLAFGFVFTQVIQHERPQGGRAPASYAVEAPAVEAPPGA